MNTKSVNTERAIGIAIYLQILFAQKKLGERQFIGGQHYALDRVLHIVMDEEQMKQHSVQYRISVHPGTCKLKEQHK